MNIPNIPDNLHKAIFVIGLALIGFAYYKYDLNMIFLENEAKKVNKLSEDVYFQKSKVQNIQNNFQILCWVESNKLNVDNFCDNDKKGNLQFYRIIKGNKNQLRVSDSLNKVWLKIGKERESCEMLSDKLEFATNDLKYFSDLNKEANIFNIILGFFGCLLSFIGLGRWWKIQSIQDKIIESQLPQSPKFRYCQSCGRNFSFRITYGRNSDNSLSELFCSDCYQNGDFTNYINEDSFKALKVGKIQNSKNKRDREKVKDRFDNLIRWNIDDYK